MVRPFRLVLLLMAVLTVSCQEKEDRLRTARTSGLVRELLTKLDSADVYAARKEAAIEDSKIKLQGAKTYRETYNVLYDIANQYAHYSLDSSLVYFERAVRVAENAGDKYLEITAEVRRSTMLTIGGFYMEAAEILTLYHERTCMNLNLSHIIMHGRHFIMSLVYRLMNRIPLKRNIVSGIMLIETPL